MSSHDEAHVLVKDVQVSVIRVGDIPVAGVLAVTTPSGDSRRFALTAEQVDGLASMTTQLAVDMAVLE